MKCSVAAAGLRPIAGCYSSHMTAVPIIVFVPRLDRSTCIVGNRRLNLPNVIFHTVSEGNWRSRRVQ